MDTERVTIPIRLDQLNLLRRISTRRLMADLPLYRGQPPLLQYIARHPGCSQAHLAERFLVSPASIAQSTKRLERVGLLKKQVDAENQRCRRLYVTEEGQKAAERFHQQLDAANETMLRGFSPEELDALEGYLTRILHNLAPMAQVDPQSLDPFVFFSLMERERENRKEHDHA